MKVLASVSEVQDWGLEWGSTLALPCQTLSQEEQCREQGLALASGIVSATLSVLVSAALAPVWACATASPESAQA